MFQSQWFSSHFSCVRTLYICLFWAYAILISFVTTVFSEGLFPHHIVISTCVQLIKAELCCTCSCRPVLYDCVLLTVLSHLLPLVSPALFFWILFFTASGCDTRLQLWVYAALQLDSRHCWPQSLCRLQPHSLRVGTPVLFDFIWHKMLLYI